MKTKVKLGMRCGNKRKAERTKSKTNRRRSQSRKHRNTGGLLTFKDITKQARIALKVKNLRNMNDAIKLAFPVTKREKRKGTIKSTRIIPISKRGGFLPLVPLFAGLNALGTLGDGAAGIAKVINNAKHAKQMLEESKRHNAAMEEISIVKGLYMTAYK